MIRKLLCWLGWHKPDAQVVIRKSVLPGIVVVSGGWGCLYCEAGSSVKRDINMVTGEVSWL